MVSKLGAGQEASKTMGRLLSGVGSLLASEAGVAQVISPPFSLALHPSRITVRAVPSLC